MKKNAIACMLIGAILSGCEPSSVTSAQERSFVSPPSFVSAEPDGYQPSADPAQREAEFTASAEYRIRLKEVLTGAEGWREADAGVQALLANTSDVPTFLKDQFAPNYILQSQLVTGGAEMNPDLQEAIGRYTNMLVRHRSPSANLIDRSLEALEGYWPDARIAETAKAAYGAAEHFVEVKAGCDGCGVTAARRAAPEGSSVGADVMLSEVADGAARLAERF